MESLANDKDFFEIIAHVAEDVPQLFDVILQGKFTPIDLVIIGSA